jgi:prepilin-type N-terminal cleavage/methylation domain-containing protein
MRTIKFPVFSRNAKECGFSIPELLIVLLIIAIIVVLALPQVMSSRRLLRFAGVQRQIVSSIREARQAAMSQRLQVTFRYDDATKSASIYGGSYGPLGSSSNNKYSISDSGLVANEVIYGKPMGASPAALGDGTNLSALTANAIEIKFRADGSVVDVANNPVNTSLFFYDSLATGSAFAVSVLGAGGRVKVWRYVPSSAVYVE